MLLCIAGIPTTWDRVGRLDEELAQTLAAQELDPVSPYVADGVAHSYTDLRR